MFLKVGRELKGQVILVIASKSLSLFFYFFISAVARSGLDLFDKKRE